MIRLRVCRDCGRHHATVDDALACDDRLDDAFTWDWPDERAVCDDELPPVPWWVRLRRWWSR